MLNNLAVFIASSTIGLFIAAFLIGSIPFGWVLVKVFYKKDLHHHGSGNVGASNVYSTTHNIFLTVLVVLFDFSKGALCMWVASLLDLPLYSQFIAGIGAVLGHDYSIFLKFSGGRGVLTTLGIYFYLSPWLGLFALVIAFGLAPFHQLALGTILAVLFDTIIISIFPTFFHITDLASAVSGMSVLAIILFTRRLIARRSPLSKNDPVWRVALCRLLFDRDIPNREAWINQDRILDTKQEV